METLRQDIAYALRQMRQSPVFTLTAMLTLALGIGATTAIFSLINTVMLKSLPVVDPASLYRIGEGNDCCVEGSPQDNWGMFSYPFYLRMKQRCTGVCGACRVPGGRHAAQRTARRERSHRQAHPRRIYHRQLLLDLWDQRLLRAHHSFLPMTSPPRRRWRCSAIGHGNSNMPPIPRSLARP